jgi:hypothetical protein
MRPVQHFRLPCLDNALHTLENAGIVQAFLTIHFLRGLELKTTFHDNSAIYSNPKLSLIINI